MFAGNVPALQFFIDQKAEVRKVDNKGLTGENLILFKFQLQL